MSNFQPGVPPFPPYVPSLLPPGWTEHQAPGGQTYYHNAFTKQSTYARPMLGMPFPVPGGMPFIAPGAIIPGPALPKEKKKKERPLVKTPVPGTSWLRVKTTEGNIFWTHKERKESVWEVPEEIKELAEQMERDEKEKEAREAETGVQQTLEEHARVTDETKRKEREEVERVMEEVKDAVAAGKRKAVDPAEGDMSSAHKKSRAEENPDELDEEWQREIADEMAEEIADKMAEEIADEMVEESGEADNTKTQPPQEANDTGNSRPLDEIPQDASAPPDAPSSAQPFFKVPDRVDLSIDEAKALFKTLLQEKNINPLHPWDTSLPLFISDPRYVLLPSVSARREAFDEYCRDAARAQRAAKAAAFKEESERARTTEGDKEKESYMKLLKEEVTSTRATWHEFRRKWKKDRRFFAWAGDRERERAFRDWVRDLADVKKKQAEKAEREFFQLLREHKEIKPGDVWKEVKRKINSKDPRYDAVGSSSLREELFVTYVKTAGGATSGDNFTQAVQGETLPQNEQEGGDAEATRRKQRAERAERGLREREDKVRRERAGLERELGRTRGAVGREEGERQFMTLLTDAVRDPQANWDTTVPSLSHDPRFVLCALPLPVQQGLFSKHVARLREKHLAGLHALFSAHASRLATRWRDLDGSAMNAIRGSVVVGKLGLSDLDDKTVQRREEDELEAEFERWQRTRNTEARQAFDAMLNENAFLEFWGRMGKVGGDGIAEATSVPDEGDEEEGEGGGGKADLKKLAQAIDKGEVEKVLKNDSRWTAFDHVPEKRQQWLKDHMEKLAAPKLSVHVPDKDRT